MKGGLILTKMKLIGDLLDDAEIQFFAGRETELVFMKNELKRDNQWRIVHFHAPHGMGKTALLRRFAKDIAPIPVLYVNTNDVYNTPQQFLNTLHDHLQALTMTEEREENSAVHARDVIERINEIANRESTFVMLFDSMELWQPIMEWLFQSFLPKLSAQVRLFSAGKYPLEGKWFQAPSWSVFVKNIFLTPLKGSAVQEYLNVMGIQNETLIDTIIRVSNGIPLAISLCCKGASAEVFEGSTLKQTIALLSQSVLKGIQLSKKQQILIEAASLVWRFDKELLAHITGDDLDITEFQHLCNLPFIMKCVEGWSLLDGIRNWIEADFKEHSPELFHQYKQRALMILQRRWYIASSLKKPQRFIELIYSIENEFLRDYYYLGGNVHYEQQPLQEEELPIIEEMWRKLLPNDDSQQETFFRSVWEKSPSSFRTFWKGDQLSAFVAMVDLNEEMRHLFKQNAPYAPYLTQSDLQKDEVLIWLAAPTDKDDFEATSELFRFYLQQFMKRRLYTLTSPIENHLLGLMSLGFVKFPNGEYVSPSGTKYPLLQLDLRNTDLFQLLFAQSIKGSKNLYTFKERVDFVKKLLISFNELESDTLLVQSLRQLLNIQEWQEDLHAITASIRTIVKQAIKEIGEKSEKNAVKMRALTLTYLESATTNELVASRLHLSTSTYYRYLKSGIEKLTMYLMAD